MHEFEPGPSWARPNWPVSELDPVNAGLDPTQSEIAVVAEKARAAAQAAGADPDAVRRAADDSIRAMMLIRTYRVRGHLAARLDPLGLSRMDVPPDLTPAFHGFSNSDLDRPIWIHPNRTAQWSDFPLSEPESRYALYSRAGWPTDTTVTMCRLVYAGYLERWPDLKIVVHHSGGTVPMIAGRLKGLPVAHGPEVEKLAALLKRPPLDYLRRFYADTANFGNPIALRAALELFGVDHVLFGTDFGFSRQFAPSTVEDVEAVVQDESQKRAIYEGNVTRLLRLQAVRASA